MIYYLAGERTVRGKLAYIYKSDSGKIKRSRVYKGKLWVA